MIASSAATRAIGDDASYGVVHSVEIVESVQKAPQVIDRSFEFAAGRRQSIHMRAGERFGMRDATHTLILTKGMYLLSSDAAEAVATALEARDAVVDVRLDLFGNDPAGQPVSVALAHVVALTKNPVRGNPATPANVTALRPQRRRCRSAGATEPI